MAKSDELDAYLKRPQYFDRQSIRAHHLSEEQQFQDRIRALDTQHLSGWGMVCGAGVQIIYEKDNIFWRVYVSKGYGKTPAGNPIVIEEDQDIDLEEVALACLGNPDSCSIDDSGNDKQQNLCYGYLVVSYVPVEKRKEAGAPDSCQSHDTEYGISGLCYGSKIEFLCHKPYEKESLHCSVQNRHIIDTHRIFSCGKLTFIDPESEYADTLILATIGFTRNGIQTIDLETDRHQLIPYSILLDYVHCLNERLESIDRKLYKKKKHWDTLDYYKYDIAKGRKISLNDFDYLTATMKKKLINAEIENADALYHAGEEKLIEVLGKNKQDLAQDLLEDARSKMERPEPLPAPVGETNLHEESKVSIDELEMLNEDDKKSLEADGIYSVAGAMTLTEKTLVDKYSFDEAKARAVVSTVRKRVFRP